MQRGQEYARNEIMAIVYKGVALSNAQRNRSQSLMRRGGNG
jgi:hypothetical protein